jgi:hypothetical protein
VSHVIGEDRTERLHIVPAQFRVLVVRRLKCPCRVCEEVVVQAPAPAGLIQRVRYPLEIGGSSFDGRLSDTTADCGEPERAE